MFSGMWAHYCTEERCVMFVGIGEPCNWCGKQAANGIATAIKIAATEWIISGTGLS